MENCECEMLRCGALLVVVKVECDELTLAESCIAYEAVTGSVSLPFHVNYPSRVPWHLAARREGRIRAALRTDTTGAGHQWGSCVLLIPIRCYRIDLSRVVQAPRTVYYDIGLHE